MENVYGGLSDWEAKGSPGGAKRRLEVIRESAAEVVPAVITAVSTTIVSFLPVFFLSGRDHRLFAPLAWTKTFALAASLIVAVTVVPMLCRVFLKSSRMRRWKSIAAAGAFGALAAPVYCTKIASRLVRTYTDRHGLKDLARELLSLVYSAFHALLGRGEY